ncbi:hypothetical protein BJP40_14425 [Streptomyces sp. CC53]|uniref:hypothetical protein n=1 Tax=unclassified Streptomyces TaxID=2593676 RepID=UPI0008DD309E|nr:hypothetical protein [Streptomyces sp. C8S0]OII66126.1 hypothetical protein BJP40_14425 [Streptomyces sp. CC53]
MRRGYLLRRLADCDWHIGRTAEALGTDYREVVARIERAGFGPLLDAHVVARRVRGTAQGGREAREG